MATTYTVVKGDTLSEIAVKYNTTVANLVKLNDIENPNYIVVGQVLVVSGSSSSGTSTKTSTSRATISVFGIQSNTDRTLYATWRWNSSNTENYQTIWYYDTGDGVWFVGNDSTTENKQSLYSAPENAKRVKFKVKPISKKRTVNNKETSYWTAGWSTEKIYDFSNAAPGKPSAPTVEIDSKHKLTARLDGIDLNATEIEFQVYKGSKKVKTGKAAIVTESATYVCTVSSGSTYKVRCRACRGKKYSAWSSYSTEVKTVPAAPSEITRCEAASKTSVYLEWKAVTTATGYEIEYTTVKRYFDNSDQTHKVETGGYNHFEVTGLSNDEGSGSGAEYFFRVRAKNEKGESAWSEIISIVLGEKPSAPTTWSSTTTVVIGEPLKLYWVHNGVDGSSQTYAELELTIDGESNIMTIANSTEEDEKDKTSVYSIDTSNYTEGVKILWRVRTSGVTNEYGDWSIERTVDVYEPPTLELEVLNTTGDEVETLESFPLKISAVANPNTQTPTSYHVTVIANDIYETVDQIGNRKTVNQGDYVYSKNFDISEDLEITLSAGDLDLENNIDYTIRCVVSMDSGLTAESTHEFTVGWTEELYEPYAEIGIDYDTVSAYIHPYCDNADVLLSVYRREYDGSFVKIASDIENTSDTFVTDPHPALDYARYRVVATDKNTGAVSYCDVPAYYVGEKAIIIQWDESWSAFNCEYEDEIEEPAWSGSLLRLPYNIDVSDNNDKDVTLIEYVGRENPVSYYGTQLGIKANWRVDIDKKDEETLYALRRLSRWMGDVYVREPSGSGYWANVKVSFSQTHNAPAMPVTLDLTRVEGGV